MPITLPPSVTLKLTQPWQERGNALFRGHFFHEGRMDDPAALDTHQGIGALIARLQAAQGFFSVIASTDEGTLLFVDHIRSYPLYYQVEGGQAVVTDDSLSLFHDRSQISAAAAMELICLGYVTGEDTLLKGVKQLEPGSWMLIHDGKVTKRRDRRSWAGLERSIGWDTYHQEFERMLAATFGLLKTVARGRQVVLPLSGGWDSRLIALCLKKHGFRDVLAFTYGREGNQESQISKAVAEALGFDWHFVPYSNQRWRQVTRSPEWRRLLAYATQMSCVPHVQDFPALLALVQEKVIDRGAVVTPGMRAASGRTVSDLTWEDELVTKEQMVQDIYTQQYKLWPIVPDSAGDRMLRQRIAAKFGPEDRLPHDRAAAMLTEWDTVDRLLVNSVRSYELFGLDWWLPLLDQNFNAFWEKVARECYPDRVAYKKSIARLADELIGPGRIPDGVHWVLDGQRTDTSAPTSTWRAVLDLVPYNATVDRTLTTIVANLGFMRRRDYERSNHAFFGAVDRREFMDTFTGTQNINSYMALDLVKQVLDPRLLAPDERELVRSVIIFRSDLLAYLKGRRAVRARRHSGMLATERPASC